jgi:hypothetical protein
MSEDTKPEAAAAAADDENIFAFVPKPKSFLERFKSKRASTIAGVETLLTALPIHKISEANDFVRLHPSEDDYWSTELCFVSVPILGEKRDQLHLIDEDLAMQSLSSKKILRHRLALATKPYDAMFFCVVPSQNIDNTWNATALKGCNVAKGRWVQVISRKAEGVENYKIEPALDADAFPAPKWTTRTLDELIAVTFNASDGKNGQAIDSENHPAFRRLIGAKQDLA